jgi:hypothetical protein
LSARRWLVLAAIAGGVAALLVLNFVLVDDPEPQSAAERCDRGDLRCYESRYARLVEDDGAERALRAFRADYERDQIVRAQCHSLVHVIGRAAGERYGDVAAAYRRGDRFCASGYYHGAMESIVADSARARALERPDGICAGTRGGTVDRGNCSHGLGHGFMVVRANEVPASLRLCDRLSRRYERGHCYDGVFMQNVMAEDDPENPSRYLDRDDPFRLCSVLAARYRESCIKRQVLYGLEVTGGDFRTMFGLCERLAAARAECDRQLGEAAADLNIRSQPTVDAQTGLTAQLCGLPRDTPARLRCAEGAARYFAFHFDRPDEAEAFCRLLGSLRERCSQAARSGS